jgi:hypothetical protein
MGQLGSRLLKRALGFSQVKSIAPARSKSSIREQVHP